MGNLREIVLQYGRGTDSRSGGLSAVCRSGCPGVGARNPTEGAVEVHGTDGPGDADLLDYAASHTLIDSGTVHTIEPEDCPSEGPLAAIYRY